MRVRLWAREDGVDEGRPKALALDATRAPGPGRIYDVAARSAPEARRILALYLLPQQPDRRTAREAWLDWDTARDLVVEVLA